MHLFKNNFLSVPVVYMRVKLGVLQPVCGIQRLLGTRVTCP